MGRPGQQLAWFKKMCYSFSNGLNADIVWESERVQCLVNFGGNGSFPFHFTGYGIFMDFAGTCYTPKQRKQHSALLISPPYLSIIDWSLRKIRHKNKSSCWIVSKWMLYKAAIVNQLSLRQSGWHKKESAQIPKSSTTTSDGWAKKAWEQSLA